MGVGVDVVGSTVLVELCGCGWVVVVGLVVVEEL